MDGESHDCFEEHIDMSAYTENCLGGSVSKSEPRYAVPKMSPNGQPIYATPKRVKNVSSFSKSLPRSFPRQNLDISAQDKFLYVQPPMGFQDEENFRHLVSSPLMDKMLSNLSIPSPNNRLRGENRVPVMKVKPLKAATEDLHGYNQTKVKDQMLHQSKSFGSSSKDRSGKRTSCETSSSNQRTVNKSEVRLSYLEGKMERRHSLKDDTAKSSLEGKKKAGTFSDSETGGWLIDIGIPPPPGFCDEESVWSNSKAPQVKEISRRNAVRSRNKENRRSGVRAQSIPRSDSDRLTINMEESNANVAFDYTDAKEFTDHSARAKSLPRIKSKQLSEVPGFKKYPSKLKDSVKQTHESMECGSRAKSLPRIKSEHFPRGTLEYQSSSSKVDKKSPARSLPRIKSESEPGKMGGLHKMAAKLQDCINDYETRRKSVQSTQLDQATTSADFHNFAAKLQHCFEHIIDFDSRNTNQKSDPRIKGNESTNSDKMRAKLQHCIEDNVYIGNHNVEVKSVQRNADQPHNIGTEQKECHGKEGFNGAKKTMCQSNRATEAENSFAFPYHSKTKSLPKNLIARSRAAREIDLIGRTDEFKYRDLSNGLSSKQQKESSEIISRKVEKSHRKTSKENNEHNRKDKTPPINVCRSPSMSIMRDDSFNTTGDSRHPLSGKVDRSDSVVSKKYEEHGYFIANMPSRNSRRFNDIAAKLNDCFKNHPEFGVQDTKTNSLTGNVDISGCMTASDIDGFEFNELVEKKALSSWSNASNSTENGLDERKRNENSCLKDTDNCNEHEGHTSPIAQNADRWRKSIEQKIGFDYENKLIEHPAKMNSLPRNMGQKKKGTKQKDPLKYSKTLNEKDLKCHYKDPQPIANLGNTVEFNSNAGKSKSLPRNIKELIAGKLFPRKAKDSSNILPRKKSNEFSLKRCVSGNIIDISDEKSNYFPRNLESSNTNLGTNCMQNLRPEKEKTQASFLDDLDYNMFAVKTEVIKCDSLPRTLVGPKEFSKKRYSSLKRSAGHERPVARIDADVNPIKPLGRGESFQTSKESNIKRKQEHKIVNKLDEVRIQRKVELDSVDEADALQDGNLANSTQQLTNGNNGPASINDTYFITQCITQHKESPQTRAKLNVNDKTVNTDVNQLHDPRKNLPVSVNFTGTSEEGHRDCTKERQQTRSESSNNVFKAEMVVGVGFKSQTTISTEIMTREESNDVAVTASGSSGASSINFNPRQTCAKLKVLKSDSLPRNLVGPSEFGKKRYSSLKHKTGNTRPAPRPNTKEDVNTKDFFAANCAALTSTMASGMICEQTSRLLGNATIINGDEFKTNEPQRNADFNHVSIETEDQSLSKPKSVNASVESDTVLANGLEAKSQENEDINSTEISPKSVTTDAANFAQFLNHIDHQELHQKSKTVTSNSLSRNFTAQQSTFDIKRIASLRHEVDNFNKPETNCPPVIIHKKVNKHQHGLQRNAESSSSALKVEVSSERCKKYTESKENQDLSDESANADVRLKHLKHNATICAVENATTSNSIKSVTTDLKMESFPMKTSKCNIKTNNLPGQNVAKDGIDRNSDTMHTDQSESSTTGTVKEKVSYLNSNISISTDNLNVSDDESCVSEETVLLTDIESDGELELPDNVESKSISITTDNIPDNLIELIDFSTNIIVFEDEDAVSKFPNLKLMRKTSSGNDEICPFQINTDDTEALVLENVLKSYPNICQSGASQSCLPDYDCVVGVDYSNSDQMASSEEMPGYLQTLPSMNGHRSNNCDRSVLDGYVGLDYVAPNPIEFEKGSVHSPAEKYTGFESISSTMQQEKSESLLIKTDTVGHVQTLSESNSPIPVSDSGYYVSHLIKGQQILDTSIRQPVAESESLALSQSGIGEQIARSNLPNILGEKSVVQSPINSPPLNMPQDTSSIPESKILAEESLEQYPVSSPTLTKSSGTSNISESATVSPVFSSSTLPLYRTTSNTSLSVRTLMGNSSLPRPFSSSSSLGVGSVRPGVSNFVNFSRSSIVVPFKKQLSSNSSNRNSNSLTNTRMEDNPEKEISLSQTVLDTNAGDSPRTMNDSNAFERAPSDERAATTSTPANDSEPLSTRKELETSNFPSESTSQPENKQENPLLEVTPCFENLTRRPTSLEINQPNPVIPMTPGFPLNKKIPPEVKKKPIKKCQDMESMKTDHDEPNDLSADQKSDAYTSDHLSNGNDTLPKLESDTNTETKDIFMDKGFKLADDSVEGIDGTKEKTANYHTFDLGYSESGIAVLLTSPESESDPDSPDCQIEDVSKSLLSDSLRGKEEDTESLDNYLLEGNEVNQSRSLEDSLYATIEKLPLKNTPMHSTRDAVVCEGRNASQTDDPHNHEEGSPNLLTESVLKLSPNGSDDRTRDCSTTFTDFDINHQQAPDNACSLSMLNSSVDYSLDESFDGSSSLAGESNHANDDESLLSNESMSDKDDSVTGDNESSLEDEDMSHFPVYVELCNGGSVTDLAKQLLKKGEVMEEILIAHVIRETLKALKHLHDNRVMHRDVKGHNILLTPEGQVKLVDFGVSGHLETESGKRRTSVGTPFWMAPEVIACEQQVDYSYDVRCDIWSLGITAIELAEGDPPLAEQHPMRALFKIPRNPSPTLQQPEKWSNNFHDFLAKCLVKDYESRPFSQQLLNHPFFLQLPDDSSELKAKLASLIANTSRVIHKPDITSKRGMLKSRRKSRREGVQTAEDLATLETLDEEAIVTQLFGRYIQQQIYTYIGDILLAVNPFTPMTIYTDEYSKKYCNAAKGDNPPHIFAVADQAYQLMIHNEINQCIVISGESGAGKTESANLLVQQLTQLGKAPNRTLEDKILQVNPLMEAFGNAKTIINDNSSRFGKYLEMIFTTSGKVIGAKITEYLLEKSRVIHQARGEQNFHIFYYLHDGLGNDDRESKYHLKDSNYYRYLDGYHTQTPDISSISINRVKFKAIQYCFEIIGFKPQDVASVYSILAAILHIGNIEFTAQEQQFAGDSCSVTNISLLGNVSSLLGIDNKDFLEALTTSGMVTRGEIIIRNNSVREAVNARDAMAKALYGRLFSWIVNKINILLKPRKSADKPPEEDSLVVSLLDIFGFENFHHNSFEQLCINIANEQLQYYFNQHIFAWEMQEYLNEGIDGSVIEFVDNRPVLDMFLAKPLGLLALLDEESNFPRASDQTLVDKFHQNIKSSHYIRPKGDNLIFCINHYAGKVAYSGFGFLEKNRDKFPIEILNLLRMSEVHVVRTLFQNPLTRTGNLAYGSTGSSKGSSSKSSAINSPISGTNTLNMYSMKNATGSMGGSKIYNMVSNNNSSGKAVHKIHNPSSSSTSVSRSQQTVATYFRNSLMDLLAKMVAGSPHFVRCIKPNDDKEAGHFNPEKVTTQLRYTGVLETTKIRRQGYSHRITFSDFLKRYYALGFGFSKIPDISRENCRQLLEKLELRDWQLGKTKVFLKYYHVEEITRKYEVYHKRIVLVQALARRWLAMRRYDQLLWKREHSSVFVQKHIRGWLVRRKYSPIFAKRRTAAVQIQTAFRGFKTRKTLAPVIEERHKAAVRIQSVIRGHKVRRQIKEKKKEEERVAMVLQEAFRKRNAKKLAEQKLREEQKDRHQAATIIQTYFRMWKCQSLYQQLLKYKSQKELQLIYFGQQVEAYNMDVYKAMIENSGRVTLDFKTSPSKSEAQRDLSLQRQLPEAQQQQQQQKPPCDVGEARLIQMKKMNEIKTLLPESEAAYYNALVSRNVAWTTNSLPKTKNVMSIDDRKYYDNIVNNVNDRRFEFLLEETLPSGVGFGKFTKGHNPFQPEIVDEEMDRLLLAKSAAKALLANKPTSPKGLYVPTMPKSESFSNLAWDAPLESARQQTLGASEEGQVPLPAPTSKGNSKGRRKVERSESGCQTDEKITKLYLPPLSLLPPKIVCKVGVTPPVTMESKQHPSNGATSTPVNGFHKIDPDPKTERSEFVNELCMDDLKHQLEQETARSVVALWQKQTEGKKENSFKRVAKEKVNQGRTLDFFGSNDDINAHINGRNKASTPKEPNKRHSSPQRLSGSPHILDPKIVHNTPEGETVFDFRAQLRRTNIDWSKTIRRSRDPSPEQVDFRHVLKHKGGTRILINTD